MQLKKMRKIGTNITYYINSFYEVDHQIMKYEDYNSDTVFNNTVEVLLSLGLIEPEFSNDAYYKTKNEFKNQTFVSTGVSKDKLHESFIDMLSKPEMYIKQKELFENICIANCCYDFDKEEYIKEACEQVSRVISEGFDEEASNYWLVKELSTVESVLRMKKYIGIIGEFEDKSMDTNYYMRMYKLDIKDDHLSDYNAAIRSKSYNLYNLISDLGSSHYNIPIYQRNYVWDEKLITRLFKDILENEYVNLNNVTFHSTSFDSKLYEIIDGQQRITTLLLTLVAIKRYLSTYFSVYDEAWANENEQLLIYYYKLERNLFEKNKIKTNFIRIEGNNDYKAFQSLMNGEKENISTRNTRIYKNYSMIYNFISDLDKDTLETFIGRFLNNVIFIVTVDSVSDEFTLFENMNTTSTPLSTIDLIKSYLLSLISVNVKDFEIRFQEAFDEKVNSALKIENGQILVDDFMRVYIRTHNMFLDNNSSLLEQYKKIKNIPKNSLNFEQVNDLLIELHEKIEMYKYLHGKIETSSIVKMKDLKIEDFIETIGVRDIYIPIMIYFSKKYMNKELTSNQVRSLLFEFECFEVKLKICSYRGQSLSKVLDNILKEIDKSDGITPDSLREILKSDHTIGKVLDISNSAFETKFKEFEFKEQISKIVLTRITNYLKNNKRIELNSNDSVRRIFAASLEHIMPVNGKKWIDAKVVTEKDHQKYVGNIGNHLLLELSLNKKNKDKLFIDKINVIKEQTHMEDDYTYRKGQNGHGFEIKELKEFTVDTIKDRQKFLTKIALEIWERK